MKTLNVVFEWGDNQLSFPFTPEVHVSYGAKPVSHIEPIREFVELGAKDGLVRIGVPSCNSRGNLNAKFRRDKVESLRIGGPIRSLDFTLYETGFPDQKQRRQYSQKTSLLHPKGDEILETKIPFSKDDLLVLGGGAIKAVTTYNYGDILTSHLYQDRVVIQLKPFKRSTASNGKLIVLARDERAAFQLSQALDQQEAHCLEVNAAIRTIIMAPDMGRQPRSVFYGIENLSEEHFALLMNNGMKQWEKDGQWGFDGAVPKPVEALVSKLSAP